MSIRTDFDDSSDALSSLLESMRPRGHIFFTGERCGDFVVDTSGNGCAHFHVITQGQCWLHTGGRTEPRALQAGDLVLFPRDARHRLLPHPPELAIGEGQAGFVSLICGYFEFASKRINPVLEALPDVVLLREADHPEDGWLANLLQFMKHEARREAPGTGMVIDRLSEVLFLFILRAVINDESRNPIFLRAFADPAIARSLSAIHNHPQRPWTVSDLAATAALSRTAFANRFHDKVGMTPAAYLSGYRMDIATDLLLQGDLSMDDIAERCGYASTAAFAKAYKNLTGHPPGKIRRRTDTESRQGPGKPT